MSVHHVVVVAVAVRVAQDVLLDAVDVPNRGSDKTEIKRLLHIGY